MPATVLDKATVTNRQQKHHPKYNVILHNDDVNDMGYVMKMLNKVLGMGKEVAYTHMMEAHETGRSILITCELEHAEFYKQGLNDGGITATIEEV